MLRFHPGPTTRPCLTTPAPTGTSPAASARWAARKASSIPSSSLAAATGSPTRQGITDSTQIRLDSNKEKDSESDQFQHRAHYIGYDCSYDRGEPNHYHGVRNRDERQSDQHTDFRRQVGEIGSHSILSSFLKYVS